MILSYHIPYSFQNRNTGIKTVHFFLSIFNPSSCSNRSNKIRTGKKNILNAEILLHEIKDQPSLTPPSRSFTCRLIPNAVTLPSPSTILNIFPISMKSSTENLLLHSIVFSIFIQRILQIKVDNLLVKYVRVLIRLLH